jgi:carbamoyltransferase
VNILGISAFYHDSAAALLCDGQLVAAAQEERFSRKKHDADFPHRAAAFCLQSQQLTLADVEYVVFYDKPFIKFERLLETFLFFAPKGLPSFIKAMPVWLKEKLFLKKMLRQCLVELPGGEQSVPKLLFTAHHQSHAASAFYLSGFETAAVLCIDGVGEWATTSCWSGQGNSLTPQWQIDFPHSLGLLYSSFTYYLGFKVNSGEYKVMGLAPYGKPVYADQIKKTLLDVKPDGSFRLCLDYFEFPVGLRMTGKKFEKLFGHKKRNADEPLEQFHKDMAASIQRVTEDIVVQICKTVAVETGERNLVLAGGVALNCVANEKIRQQNIFENVWVQPAAGDAGGAAGAAYAAWFDGLGKARNREQEKLRTTLLGPQFNHDEIKNILRTKNIPYHESPDKDLFNETAEALSRGKIVGWFQGRMEYGPRALGARSILADARDTNMQSTLNQKIKKREGFRPFAPVCLQEETHNWFTTKQAEPFMTFTTRFSEKAPAKLPAVTHCDGSARLQTIAEHENDRMYQLLKAFHQKTGCPVLVNTSFNQRGEPVVCTPQDAFSAFLRCELDMLVMGNLIVRREDIDLNAFDDELTRVFTQD